MFGTHMSLVIYITIFQDKHFRVHLLYAIKTISQNFPTSSLRIDLLMELSLIDLEKPERSQSLSKTCVHVLCSDSHFDKKPWMS